MLFSYGGKVRDLALCLCLQGKCAEAFAMAEESLSLGRSFGKGGETGVVVALTIYEIVCSKCGRLDGVEEYLTQATTIGQKLHAHLDRAPIDLATVYEVLKAFDKDEHFYQLSHGEAHSLGRHYYEYGALTGLVRVKHAQHDYAAIPSLWTEAEQLAQQYEYNDYLTSSRLTRGYITWDGNIPKWEKGRACTSARCAPCCWGTRNG